LVGDWTEALARLDRAASLDAFLFGGFWAVAHFTDGELVRLEMDVRFSLLA
jgi:hypothetical protein